MTRLFTYCIPFDDGAAPNPFWGVCTLAICKPAIRRVAAINDWVVGTGSLNSPLGSLGGAVVYAMRIEDVVTMAQYDRLTRRRLRNKVPAPLSDDRRRQCGDSIYDFSHDPPSLRPSFHQEGNRTTDIGGANVLMSRDFLYFGDRPVDLPPSLLAIVRQGQGHQSTANQPYLELFIRWVRGLGLAPGTVVGNPQAWRGGDSDERRTTCARSRRVDGEEDLRQLCVGEVSG